MTRQTKLKHRQAQSAPRPSVSDGSRSQVSHSPAVPASQTPAISSISVTAPVQMQDTTQANMYTTKANILKAKQNMIDAAGPVSRVARLKSWASRKTAHWDRPMFGENYTSHYQEILNGFDSAASANSRQETQSALAETENRRKLWARTGDRRKPEYRRRGGDRAKHLLHGGQAQRDLSLLSGGLGYSLVRRNARDLTKSGNFAWAWSAKANQESARRRINKGKVAAAQKGKTYKPTMHSWKDSLGHPGSRDYQAAMSHLQPD
jgi:hypothetical protein